MRALPDRDARDEAGAVAVIFAISALTLFIIAGLVVDLGLARDTRRQSQNAADASALAAALVLYPASGVCASGPATPPCFTDAVDAAKTYALNNFSVSAADWSTCTDPSHFYVPSGSTPCVSFTDNSLATSMPPQPTKIRVLVPVRTVKTGLGALAGVSSIPIASVARAALTPGGGGPCGLCVIGPGEHDLQNGDATVTGASVYFNGSLALNPQGSVTSNGGSVGIEGTPPNKGTVSPAPNVGGAPVSDPMAGLTLPPDTTGLVYKAAGNMCTGGPGIYLNPTASNCTLSAGLYVVIGGTFGGNNGVVANNVTLYFTCRTGTVARTCNPNESGGTLDLSGNGNFTLSAPSTSVNKSIPQVAVAFDRNNAATVRMVGNGLLNVTGSIYLKSGTLDMRGNGCTAQTNINSLIVVDDLAFSGANACLDSDYTLNANYQVPPGDPALDE